MRELLPKKVIMGLVFLIWCGSFVFVYHKRRFHQTAYFVTEKDRLGISDPPSTSTISILSNSHPADLFNMTVEETTRFFSIKEHEFAIRRSRVATVCQIVGSEFARKVTDGSLFTGDANFNRFVYVPQEKVFYCQIPKVASSTWCSHFIKLANVTEKQYHQWRNALQIYVTKLWPLPEEGLLGNKLSSYVTKEFTSFVIVRHPFSRLTSVYHQKIIDLGLSDQSWKAVNQNIINGFRKSKGNLTTSPDDKLYQYPGDNPAYASPQEFLEYVSNSFRQDPNNIDQHWRPQHSFCPLCSLNFTVLAKMETLIEDSTYFLLKSELYHKLADAKLQNNPSKSGGVTKERGFWSRVEPDLVLQLYNNYKLDFVMFDYSVRQYFHDHDLAEKVPPDSVESLNL